MTNENVWFIPGAGRGMGVEIARAALAAGNTVVATGRNPRPSPRPLARTTENHHCNSTSREEPLCRLFPPSRSIMG